jgi:alpha-1,3-rhamnosyl/mannosyltransferase
MDHSDILLVADQYGKENSGMGVYAFEIATRIIPALAAKGYKLSVALRNDADLLADAARQSGATVVTLRARQASVVQRMKETLFTLPKYASATGCYYSLDHKIPLRLGPHTRKIATIHDTCSLECPAEFPGLRGIYFRNLMPMTARSADQIITVSDFAATRINQLLGVSRSKVAVAPNGFDHGKFKPQPDTMDLTLRSKYHLPQKYFLFLGRVSPRKNLGLVARAVKLLVDQGETPVVALAGPAGFGESTDWDLIKDLGITKNFMGLTYVPDDLLPALYRQSCGLLYPSKCEGFGLPVLEALACGVPVIVSEGTSASEIGNAFVERVHSHDFVTLSKLMLKLLRQGREPPNPTLPSYLDSFSWEKAAATVREVVCSVVGPPRQPKR